RAAHPERVLGWRAGEQRGSRLRVDGLLLEGLLVPTHWPSGAHWFKQRNADAQRANRGISSLGDFRDLAWLLGPVRQRYLQVRCCGAQLVCGRDVEGHHRESRPERDTYLLKRNVFP